ncbi:DUF1048 domain-containing protein [Enterococcus sp. DIV0660C]|nr:DUF1048 domain-containing protein [Enterococcus sp. DIV0660C]
MMEVQYELIDLLEEGIVNRKNFLEVIRTNVAAFCDEFLKRTKMRRLA